MQDMKRLIDQFDLLISPATSGILDRSSVVGDTPTGHIDEIDLGVFVCFVGNHIAFLGEKTILITASIERIISTTAKQAIITGLSRKRVIAGPTVQDVIASST